MKSSFKMIILILGLLCIQGCMRTKVVEAKSPCVSIGNGPCGVKKPINTWLYMTI